MSLDAGTRIGRYEIQSLIGAGGMGEVYRALDTELNRPVALKFLHADVAMDQDRMSRFIQEARAASALNHPNILTVFDIGQTDAGARFFATEFVQGTTLREHITARRMKLGEVLDFATQIASALAAAHAEGIVHRDIKPENVMVRADGYVKVLDFGLAKVTTRQGAADVDTEAATRALVNTNPGAIMGTVAYMSPEQARGEQVDARTDIWSLGCVLYEMLTGHVPFEGRSASHVIVGILDAEPPPLAHYLPEVSEALQEVVTDALTKDRDARFQTAKQMLAKLQRLRQRLDAGVSLDHSSVPGFAAPTAGGAGGATFLGNAAGRTFAPDAPGRTTAGDLAAQDTVTNSGVGSAAAAGGGARRRSFTANAFALALAALVAVAALAYGVYHFARVMRAKTGAPFASLQNMKFTKLQAAGQTTIATISPDGKYVARTVYEAGKVSVRVRQLATTTEKELVAPSESGYNGLTFSPDGAFLYYVTVPLGGNLGDLYRVPSLLGGAPQRIISDVDSEVTFSPDGKQLAFRRHVPKTNEDTIVVASEDGGGGERVLVRRKAPVTLPSLAWSPDGRQIAFAVRGTDENGYYMNVESVRVEDGAAQTVSGARWRSVGMLSWLADGSGLVFNGRDRASLPSTPEQIWFVAYPGGEAQKITNDVNSYTSVSLTSDSRTLLALQSSYSADIWLSGGGGADAPRQLTQDGSAGTPAWTPDGRIVYQSGASGNGDIWVMNADGGGQRQLTFDPNNDASPDVSRDGRLVVFISNRSVGWSIWIMNADGSGQRELVRNVEQYSFPHFAPDNRAVYYASRDGAGGYAFWRVPVEGGEPSRVTEQPLSNARVSPDGKTLFTLRSKEITPNAPRQIAVLPVEGGEPLRTFDAPPALDMPRWSPDGQGIDYVLRREGASGLWRQPLAGGQPRQITDLKTYFINWYAWTPDGRQLAVARGNPVTEMILIKDFK